MDWRNSGELATGLTAGERIVEFRPVPGFAQPSNEAFSLTSDDETVVLERDYDSSGTVGAGSLVVSLSPDFAATNGRWRFVGEGAAAWRASGTEVSGLVPGSYVVEAEPISGLATPLSVNLRVFDGQQSGTTITYFPAEDVLGTEPSELTFADISLEDEFPFPWVGQLRSEIGRGTGFVVRPCVVGTVAHVVFDDNTLSTVTDLQWLFQLHSGEHEPEAQTPRGLYLLTGYAAQRESDIAAGVPEGESSVQSQNLDVATLYFNEDAGRGGFSGFLASDLQENEFITSTDNKILVGYPIDGIAEEQRDRMHATPPLAVALNTINTFGQTYTTSEIRSTGGSSGGPLCVLAETGTYHPAAVYLGGTEQTVVRAFDSDIVQLFGFAEASCELAEETGGTFLAEESTQSDFPDDGVLRVNLEPELAREVGGAGWRINALDDFNASGDEIVLAPGSYVIQFSEIPGFVSPIVVPVELAAGELETVTFTYEELVFPPEITSPTFAEFTFGARLIPDDPTSPFQQVDYQIVTEPAADNLVVSGILPLGVTFDATTGEISGVPEESGLFELVLGATSVGGADSQGLALLVRPNIPRDQVASFTLDGFGEFLIESTESGEGLLFEASGLPEGLTLASDTGRIAGTPTSGGEFEVLVTVTRQGGTSLVTPVTVAVLDPNGAPVFTLEPADESGEFGLASELVAIAEGAPEIRYQWFEGFSGNITNPVEGATEPILLTSPLFNNRNFWVRAQSVHGVADSRTATVTLGASANSELTDLEVSEGALLPVFNPNITEYDLEVASTVTELTVTPSVAVVQTEVNVEGVPVERSAASSLDFLPSAPVALNFGVNVVEVEAVAGDGSTRVYTLNVIRSGVPVPTTGNVTLVTDVSATLLGTVLSNDRATAFFEYGETTDYGFETGGRFVSPRDTATAISLPVSGLSGSTTYHYRLCVTLNGEVSCGADATFTTSEARPRVATGNPVNITTGSAVLLGAVDPLASDAEFFFRFRLFGTTPWTETERRVLSGGSGAQNVSEPITGLVPFAEYEFQILSQQIGSPLIAEGDRVRFVAELTPGTGDGVPDSPPVATTGAASEITQSGAILNGEVNPNDGTTLFFFEYGPTTDFGLLTAVEGLGNGIGFQAVSLPVEDLELGVTYFYRLVAENSEGQQEGATLSFTTIFESPVAITGGAEAESPTEATLFGEVDAQGDSIPVFFEFGTDGVTFPSSEAIVGTNVAGLGLQEVQTTLTELTEGQIFFYRIRAGEGVNEVFGEVRELNVQALLGIRQVQPPVLELPDFAASLRVDLSPAVGNWRFEGERIWRDSGEVVNGLPDSVRTIEFRPVDGFVTPPSVEQVVLNDGGLVTVAQNYYSSARQQGEGGTLSVDLLPEVNNGSFSAPATAGQWRLLGDENTTWLNSGETLSDLEAGIYLVETRPVAGWTTPVPEVVEIEVNFEDVDSQGNLLPEPVPVYSTVEIAIAYKPSGPPVLFPPQALSLEDTQDPLLPFSFVGQIESEAGLFSGFVVSPRVVATAAQVIFDEESLTFIDEVRWSHQREQGVYEPNPQIPRGYYNFEGYAARRIAEDSPQELSLESQNENVAALYFFENAGRGGSSGFLASSAEVNEFLSGSEEKTLVGYPTRTVSPTNRGRMHATPFSSASWSQRFEQVYGLPSVPGESGFIGGPLCVQFSDGLYYPAGIFVGCGAEGRVRAIDNQLVDLLGRAAVTANGGEDQVNGGITLTNFSIAGAGSVGSLRVIIQPQAAAELALWNLSPLPADFLFGLSSGNTLSSLSEGMGELILSEVPGFLTPPVPEDLEVEIRGGRVSEVVFTYEAEAVQLSPIELFRSEFFGNSANIGIGNDLNDPDGDGVNNGDEFLAGTSPLDNLQAIPPVRSPEQAAVGILTGIDSEGNPLAGRQGGLYTLERLASPAQWIDVGQTGPLDSDVVADEGLEVIDLNPPNDRALYRVRLEYP